MESRQPETLARYGIPLFAQDLLVGLILFVSCSYILVLNPAILATAGFPASSVFAATALTARQGLVNLHGYIEPFAFGRSTRYGFEWIYCKFLRHQYFALARGSRSHVFCMRVALDRFCLSR